MLEAEGLTAMAREIQRTTRPGGDYTSDRHALTGHLTIEDVVARMDAIQRSREERERQAPND